MDEPPIEARALERRFGARIALRGVDLRVDRGEIVGLVGPNGSGKSTLLRLLAGFLRPCGGEARVFGLAPFAERHAVMKRARFAFAPPALFDALTAREHLVHLARIHTGSAPPAKDVHEILEIVGLAQRGDDRVREFSFGMRQRLALAQALLPRPELLVLDEPTDGLDPLAILELRAVLARLREEHGITVLLSSHLLIEIEELVDRMLVLCEGVPIFLGKPRDLCVGSERIVLGVSDAARARSVLTASGLEVSSHGEGRLEVRPGLIDLSSAVELLRSAGVELTSFHERRATVEEALLERLRSASTP